MRELLLLAIHLIVTVARLFRPGGARSVAAESLLLKQQLIIGHRSRRRAPNLTSLDRLVLGLITLFIRPHRIPTLSGILKPDHPIQAPQGIGRSQVPDSLLVHRPSPQARSERTLP
jgi:hypothetical protein